MNTEDRHMHAAAESEAWHDAHAGHQAMWPQMIAALAAIDTELGLPEDGCNSTGRTLAAVRELKDRAASAQQQSQALARAVMADQTAHDTWTRNALRFQLLLDGPHNFGVFVCGPEGEPDDSISNEELTAALDSMLGAEDVEPAINAEELKQMVAWAYSKLHHASYSKQDDALMLDRMKLLLEFGA